MGPLLAMVRPALDFDHDGYPGLLGGGDCDDGNSQGQSRPPRTGPRTASIRTATGAICARSICARRRCIRCPAAVPRDLNILLIVIDTLRADRLGAYGYKRPTSARRWIAWPRDGVLFENAWAHAPSTRYSMPAIVTGRWPSRHPLGHPALVARHRARTHAPSPRCCAPRVTSTAPIYAYRYFNRGEGRGFERGIDQYDDRLAAKHINPSAARPNRSESSAREMADDGIDFLRAYRDQKFFLTLHFYDPHLNYERHADAPDFGVAAERSLRRRGLVHRQATSAG